MGACNCTCRHNLVKESFEGLEKVPPMWAWAALTVSMGMIFWATLVA